MMACCELRARETRQSHRRVLRSETTPAPLRRRFTGAWRANSWVSAPETGALPCAVAQIPLRFSVAGGAWMSQEDANSAEIEFASRRAHVVDFCEL